MVNTQTGAWPGQPQSGLDHLYTNYPSKLSEVYTEYTGGSDHKLVKVTRFAKSMKKNCMSGRGATRNSMKKNSSRKSESCLGMICTSVKSSVNNLYI